MVEGFESGVQQVVEGSKGAVETLINQIHELWNDRVTMPKHKEQQTQEDKEKQEGPPEVGTAKQENPRPDNSLPNLELVLKRIPEKAPDAKAEDKRREGSYGGIGNPLEIDTIPAIVDFKGMTPT